MHNRRTIAAVIIGTLLATGIIIGVVIGTGNPASPAVNLVADVTPFNWIPVDFGNAQISVPPFLPVAYDQPCPQEGLYVGYASLPRHQTCSKDTSVAPLPTVVMLPISNAPTAQSVTSATINGISVEEMATQGIVDVWASQLGIFLRVDGGMYTSQILRTLAYSPAAVVLEPGAAPNIPSTWHWVTVGSLQFAVPKSWPTTSPLTSGPTTSPLTFGGELQYFDTPDGGYPSNCSGCQMGGQQQQGFPRQPVDGVVVDVPPPGNAAPDRILGQCYFQKGLNLCPYKRPLTPGHDQNAEDDILFVQATVQASGKRYVVEIGLTGNGMTSRTVLYSLRAG